jgi:hypothetical protein
VAADELVAEWMTMSAPHSIGRHRYGVAKVLSTISGSSCSCAIDATVSMSEHVAAGLPIVSPKKAFVFAHRLAPRVRIVGSTQVSSTFILRKQGA